MRCALIAASLAWLALAGTTARAQEPSEEDARVLFERANEALATGRFAEARDLLRRSLEITPNPASAFNLAVALRGTGETIESVAMFDALLEGEYGTLSAAQRREAMRLRAETRAEIALLHISATGADEIEVRVDGQRVAVVSEGEVVEHPVDPGTRVVTASAPRRETEERRIALERGSSRRVEFELQPSADARLGTLVVEAVHPEDVLEIVGIARGTGTLRRQLEPGTYEIHVDGPAGRRESTVELEAGTTLRVRLETEGGGILASPWLWGGVGVVVVGLVVGGLVLFGDREEDPVRDPVYGVVTTLRVP